jgi:hypothetical protein
MLSKRILYSVLSFCLIFSCFNSFGQQRQLNRPPDPKIRALKIQVVTKDMNLTPAERNQFLPLYTKYSNELLVVYRQKHALKNNSNSAFVVNERLRLDQEIVSIKTKYKSLFLKIISPQQLEKMYQGEDEFKRLLIERLKHKD